MNPAPFIIISIAPVVAVFYFYFYKHLLSKETLFLFRICFTLGIVSFFIFYFFDLIAGYYDLNTIRSLRRTLFTSFVVKGFGEQFAMFLFLKFLFFPQKGFSRSFHGLLFAIMLALGMATAENIFYAINNGGKDFILLKGYTSVPAHITFAVLMGFFIGYSKFRNMRFVLALVGLGSASFLQGIYEFCMFNRDTELIIISFVGSTLIVIVLYVKAAQYFRNSKTIEGPQESL